MSKIIMFMRDEMYAGEKERNEEFRKIVKEFVPYIIEGEISIGEYCVNTKTGYNRAFDENPDCELVFTIENDTKSQKEACSRKKLVFEWRCFNSKRVVPVEVTPLSEDGSCLSVSHYSIYTSL